MLSLSNNKFLQYQDRYYRQVMNLPPKVIFIRQVVTPGATAYEIMTKDVNVTPEQKEVKCLYKRDFNTYERRKYGLSEDCSGAIYIPPKILTDMYGGFKSDFIDFHKIDIKFTDYKYDEVYVVDKVVYLEPHYGTCIAVMLHLKSKTTA